MTYFPEKNMAKEVAHLTSPFWVQTPPAEALQNGSNLSNQACSPIPAQGSEGHLHYPHPTLGTHRPLLPTDTPRAQGSSPTSVSLEGPLSASVF